MAAGSLSLLQVRSCAQGLALETALNETVLQALCAAAGDEATTLVPKLLPEGGERPADRASRERTLHQRIALRCISATGLFS